MHPKYENSHFSCVRVTDLKFYDFLNNIKTNLIILFFLCQKVKSNNFCYCKVGRAIDILVAIHTEIKILKNVLFVCAPKLLSNFECINIILADFTLILCSNNSKSFHPDNQLSVAFNDLQFRIYNIIHNTYA